MQIVGGIITAISYHPHDIVSDGIVEVSSTCELTPREIQCFDKALYLVEKALKSEGIYSKELHAHVFFVHEDVVSILYNDPYALGQNQPTILYFVHRWRSYELADQDILVAMLEEFCHCLWHIRDEYVVKEKVVTVARPLIPDASIKTLYQGKFVIPAHPV